MALKRSDLLKPIGFRVFISYAREDAEFVRELHQDLRAHNIESWIDVETPPGKDWEMEIWEALRTSSMVVLIASAASVRSSHVRAEVGYALKHHKDVIPVLIENTELPPRWQLLQYIDWTSPQNPPFNQLVTELLTRAATLRNSQGIPAGSWETEPHRSLAVSSRPLDVVEVQRSFGIASRTLLDWPQETDGQWVERPELERLRSLAMQAEPTVTVLLGAPGEGKSALLARLGNQLANEGVVLLAIKADRLPRSVSTLSALDSWVGAPLPVADALRRLAAERRIVLLIDQLDALADLMDQHSGRLSALLRLVHTVRDTKNLQVLISCREFEFRNDVRLNSIKTVEVTLKRLIWEQILPLLTARGLNPTVWNEEVRDILCTPQHLAVFLTHIVAGQKVAPAFATYQGLLDWVITERIDRPYGARTLEAAERIATVMAQEEELWLGKRRFEREYKDELQNLANAKFLVFSPDGQSLSFRHQTLFDFLRARAFLSETVSLSRCVLAEKQESLFVRPVLWSALHYLRNADQAIYRREFRILWAAESLRLHLRYLLVAFLGQLGDPEDEEARWLLPTLDNPELRSKALKAMAGSRGWFSRLKSRTSMLMTAPPNEAWEAVLLLRKAVVFDRDTVLALIERHWLSGAEYLPHMIQVLNDVSVWDQRSIDLATRVAGTSNVATFHIQYLAERIAQSRPDLAPIVVVRHLEAQLAQVDATPAHIPDPPPEDAPEDEHIAYFIARNAAVNGRIEQLLEKSHDWYGLKNWVARAPKAFLDHAWPWLVGVLSQLAEETDHSLLNSYRAHKGIAFRREEAEQHSLSSAFHAAAKALAKDDPDSFLAFVAANKGSDLMAVHHILSLGLEQIALTRAHDVLTYLLEDPRRLVIGSRQDKHYDTQRLIAAVAQHLENDEVLRLERTIVTWPLYRVPADEDAQTRFERRKWTRQARLHLLRSLPIQRLSPQGRRHIQEEERALPHTQSHNGGVEVHWIGSPMSATQMLRAYFGR